MGGSVAFAVAATLLIVSLVRSRKPHPSPLPILSDRQPVPPRRSDGRLRCLSGTHAGMEFPLSDETIKLGRDRSWSQIVFKESDELVSRQHCTVRFDRQTGGVVLEDCGSTHGTFLENGERLKSRQPRVLRPNGRFYVGSKTNMFQVN